MDAGKRPSENQVSLSVLLAATSGGVTAGYATHSIGISLLTGLSITLLLIVIDLIVQRRT